MSHGTWKLSYYLMFGIMCGLGQSLQNLQWCKGRTFWIYLPQEVEGFISNAPKVEDLYPQPPTLQNYAFSWCMVLVEVRILFAYHSVWYNDLHCGSKKLDPCYIFKWLQQILINIHNFAIDNMKWVSNVHICNLRVLMKQGTSLG